MILSNQPLVEGTPVQFTLTGFPDETAVKSSIERFYTKAPHANRNFLVNNTFDERIISGHADTEGKIEEYTSHQREDKNN